MSIAVSKDAANWEGIAQGQVTVTVESPPEVGTLAVGDGGGGVGGQCNVSIESEFLRKLKFKFDLSLDSSQSQC